MTERIFGYFWPETGFPHSWFIGRVWSIDNIPIDAVRLSEGQYAEFINHPGERRWDGEKVVDLEGNPQPQPWPEPPPEEGGGEEEIPPEELTLRERLGAVA